MIEPVAPRQSPVVTSAHSADPVAWETSDLGDLAGAWPEGGSALKLAIVGPCHRDPGPGPRNPGHRDPGHPDPGSIDPGHIDNGGVAAHTTTLAHLLAQAGHDVTLVSWSHPFPGRRFPGERTVAGPAREVPAFPRTIRALSWARPDTWVRTGRRLRGFDAIIVVHVRPLLVPAHLAMLRAAGVGEGTGGQLRRPRSIVIARNVLPHGPRFGDIGLIRSLFERVDAVVVRSLDQARLAQDLHATRVSVADPLPQEPIPRREQIQSQQHRQDHSQQGQSEQSQQEQQNGTPDLSSPWAHYVGAMEALASPYWQAAEQDSPEPTLVPPLWTRLAAPVRQTVRRRRATLPLTRTDLPDWARPSDVLDDGADADDARAWARAYGLPRCADPVAAWSALGALAAIVRLGDDGHRSAVIVDGSGPRSPLSRWARAIGFAPVELDLIGRRASALALDVDTASLDVITQLHPNGCDSEDVDEALNQASWALRTGGLISLTLPLGSASAEGAVGPADVRAILARAHGLGLVLVGDLDGEIAALMRAASEGVRRSDAAYALVRLTFRRR